MDLPAKRIRMQCWCGWSANDLNDYVTTNQFNVLPWNSCPPQQIPDQIDGMTPDETLSFLLCIEANESPLDLTRTSPTAGLSNQFVETPIDQFESAPDHFGSLNDDCCFAILERLPPDHLHRIRQTCKRLNEMALNCFARKYRSKVLHVTYVTHRRYREIGKITARPKGEEYVKYFTNHVENVILSRECSTRAALTKFTKLYEHTGSPIKSLTISKWPLLRQIYGRVLAKVTQNVESITLLNTKLVGDLNKSLLQYVPQLKRLTLLKKLDGHEGGWMHRTYAKLEYFAWHLKSEINVTQVRDLLITNPTIKTFSLLTMSEQTIKALITDNVRVDELFIEMHDFKNALEMLTELLGFCEKYKCYQLHLKISQIRVILPPENHIQLMSLAPYIRGLYFENEAIFNRFSVLYSPLTLSNLKVIGLPSFASVDRIQKDPRFNMNSLEEVFISEDIANFHEYSGVMLTLCQLPHLRKIYLRNSSTKFGIFNFARFNALRRMVKKANKLKVFFCVTRSSFTGKLYDLKTDFDMIEVSHVETEIVSNPLAPPRLTDVRRL